MKTLRSSFLKSFLLLIALLPAAGTTVIPPTFDELVTEADVIFQGTVTEVRSEWTGEGAQRVIVSYVTYRIDEPIKEQPGATYTLRMFGGTVNGETMGIADAPQFKSGDRDILFVENNGTQFVPLVGIMHGRFRVRADAVSGKEIVLTDTGAPLTDVSALGKNRALFETDTPNASTPALPKSILSVDEFKTAIRTTLATSGG